MKKLLISLLFVAIAFQPSFAMDHKSSRKISKLDSTWEGFQIKGLPRHITIFNHDDTITTERITELNPAWMALKESLTQDEKNDLLRLTRWYPGGDYTRCISRCIVAIALCIGANVDTVVDTCMHSTVLRKAALHQDLQLTKYILSMKANPNFLGGIMIDETPIYRAKSIALAELLINNGATIPATILHACAAGDYPAALMQFYIDKGVQPRIDKYNDSPLHRLAGQYHTPEQVKLKTRILLKTKIDPLHQDNRSQTFLHDAAEEKRDKLCSAVIDHYLEQHQGFLQFLAYIKAAYPILYATKGLLKHYFNESASSMKILYALLKTKNDKGETPFDILPIKELDPATYSYAKYLALKSATQENVQ